METLKFIPEGSSLCIYKSSYFMQVVPHSIINGTIKQSAHALCTCRDLLVYYLRNRVRAEDLNLSQTRIMFHQDGKNVGWLKHGLRLINLVEEKFGWTKSVLYKVETKHNAHLMIGTKKWISSPALISLYLCIINAPRTNSDLGKIETYDKLISYFKEHQDEAEDFFTTSDYSFYLSEHIDKWPLLLANFNSLFFGKKTMLSNYGEEVAFTPAEEKAYDNTEDEKTRMILRNKANARLCDEGIHKLCQFQSGDVKLTRRFSELCNKSKSKVSKVLG
jgi:hypothetical protein